MSQIITKLSERRALKKAKAAHKRTIKLFEKLGPEKVAEFDANIAKNFPDLTSKEIAGMLIRDMVAAKVREFAQAELAPPQEMIADLVGEHIEEILEGMVEGDDIIDDARVHAFHRRMLDELRASLANLENHGKTSLSYDAIRTDFATAKFLFELDELDEKTEARFIHMKTFGQMLIEHQQEFGDKATEDEAEKIFQITSMGIMASAYDEHGMSIEDIADALDSPPEVVTEALRMMVASGHRTARTGAL
jgi:uncharacterized DUF497 family protein